MGTFTIKNVPAGAQSLHVWHERYGRLTMKADVKAGATTTVDFEYTGTEQPSAAGLHELLIPSTVMAAR
jgi:hypothetical protein